MSTPQPPSKTQMRRLAWASLIGTTIEFYDFLISGTAAALVFNKTFFPALGTASATMLSFATLGVAFVARPLGAILFGHYGDRVGRKKTLVSTLLLMGLSTVAVGLLPTTGQIGVLAPILLVLLRVCQGLAVGGEWAGATLLTAENAPEDKRGTYALFPQLGPSLGFVLASTTFLSTRLMMSSESFAAWGWRIPFLLSIVLIAVGMYMRLNIGETATFRQAVGTQKSSRNPFLEAVTRQPREILLGTGAVSMCFAFYYIGVTYLTSYGTEKLGLSQTFVLAVGIAIGATLAVSTIVGARLSDRIGRRRMMSLGNLFSIVFALLMFPILSVGTTWAYIIGACLSQVGVGLAYGPVGAMLPELFATRYRYTGAGLSYNLAGVLGGAVTPLLAVQLQDSFGGLAIGLYLAGVAAVSLLCALAGAETSKRRFDSATDPVAAPVTPSAEADTILPTR
ncbi:MFS transporter [Nocardia caishijiensis]|uniref:Metabolite-proton symporter n=1 Tax=Nocardia caishijiensis TaxID=184756 RepID=A0ABQ6YHX0_9NOCA|nr:MFS transporter [Nocardia caishijiensis]KAF0845195.1 metabolite-proton symporter [Nocardia caishijiensis]